MLTILMKLFYRARHPLNAPQKRRESFRLQLNPLCAFCGQSAAEMACAPDGEDGLKPLGSYRPFSKRRMGHTTGLWTCPCTAIGSGAWGPDLDEAVSLLQEALGFELNEAQVEHLRQFERDHFNFFTLLQERFRLNHYELRLNTHRQEETSLQWLWARRTFS